MRHPLTSTLTASTYCIASLTAFAGNAEARGGCTPEWGGDFGQRPGLSPFIGNPSAVFEMEVFDDGNGPQLYVGGMWEKAGGVVSPNIARFDGERWTSVGPGTNNFVRDFVVFDDGSGPALYVAGDFSHAGGLTSPGVAKFDGTNWSALPSGSGFSRALAVYDDGTGPALYAGGNAGVRKFNGVAWTNLPSLTTGSGVEDLTVFDRGFGPELVIAGWFDGFFPQRGIVFWKSGATYSGYLATNARVECVHVGPGIGGNALYFGGDFTSIDDFPPVAAVRVARYDGVSVHPLGAGANNTVESVQLFDDGGGVALYAGGYFTSIGGVATNGLARWNGSAWSAAGSGIAAPFGVNSLATFDGGSGSRLYVGGNFDFAASGVGLFDCARLDGATLRPLGNGFDGDVYAVASFDDGSGPALHVGGSFRSANGVLLNGIAKRAASGWVSLAGGMAGLSGASVRALEVQDFGSGPRLYAAGEFTTAGGTSAQRIARWDGSSWSPLGGGLDRIANALLSFDDVSGPALYVGGEFQSAGGTTARLVAKWNGTAWSGFGAGLTADSGFPAVYDLAFYDDGTGPRLHVCGSFTKYQQINVNRIARWTGASWGGLGSGFSAGIAYALQVFDEGSGPALFVGGEFGILNGIRRWKNNTWSAVGGGLGPDAGARVRALQLHDDGSGLALHAGGKFGTAGGVPAQHVARWNGAAWSALEGGVGIPYGVSPLGLDVLTFATVADDSPNGASLIAAGSFTQQAGGNRSHIARWGCDSPSRFTNVGGATSGSFGKPLLEMSGTLTPASVLGLEVMNAPPSAAAVIFVSLGSSSVSFLGGTLHAFPVVLGIAVATQPNGELALAGPFPGAAPGTTFGFQVAIQDAAVPYHGAVLSNGVVAVVP